MRSTNLTSTFYGAAAVIFFLNSLIDHVGPFFLFPLAFCAWMIAKALSHGNKVV